MGAATKRYTTYVSQRNVCRRKHAILKNNSHNSRSRGIAIASDIGFTLLPTSPCMVESHKYAGQIVYSTR